MGFWLVDGGTRDYQQSVRLVTFAHRKQQRVGVLHDDAVIALPFGSMIELISAGSTGMAQAHAAIQDARAVRHPISKILLLAPIPKPGKMLFSGLNYKSHINENPHAKFLDGPRCFAKLNNCVIGPGAPILHPGAHYQVDYEVELGVVIGTRCHRIDERDAMRYVFGYTILHDVSARLTQFKDNNETMGKNYDTFAPMGPCIVTADEIPDPSVLGLRTWLNGKLMQDGTNRDWCFQLPHLLAWLAGAMTLEPGDIVTTGTPSGVGYFRKPQVFLSPGDVVRLEIDEIGSLTNPVHAISDNQETA